MSSNYLSIYIIDRWYTQILWNVHYTHIHICILCSSVFLGRASGLCLGGCGTQIPIYRIQKHIFSLSRRAINISRYKKAISFWVSTSWLNTFNYYFCLFFFFFVRKNFTITGISSFCLSTINSDRLQLNICMYSDICMYAHTLESRRMLTCVRGHLLENIYFIHIIHIHTIYVCMQDLYLPILYICMYLCIGSIWLPALTGVEQFLVLLFNIINTYVSSTVIVLYIYHISSSLLLLLLLLLVGRRPWWLSICSIFFLVKLFVVFSLIFFCGSNNVHRASYIHKCYM